MSYFLGKIRVFCRIRPVNRCEVSQGGAMVVEKIDDYSVTMETPRGPREFQFDKVFSAEVSQEDLFHDTNRYGGYGSQSGTNTLYSQIYHNTHIMGPKRVSFDPPLRSF